jgi:hypothetical protein
VASVVMMKAGDAPMHPGVVSLAENAPGAVLRDVLSEELSLAAGTKGGLRQGGSRHRDEQHQGKGQRGRDQ